MQAALPAVFRTKRHVVINKNTGFHVNIQQPINILQYGKVVFDISFFCETLQITSCILMGRVKVTGMKGDGYKEMGFFIVQEVNMW